MLNEAEAFTLKNKKYPTEADLMTSENSFLNCFRPKDFNLSVRIFNNYIIFRKDCQISLLAFFVNTSLLKSCSVNDGDFVTRAWRRYYRNR